MNHAADIVVVGAGPAGLSFCRAFDGVGLNIIVIEKLPVSVLENPPFDAREIALTHLSVDIMQKLNIWQHIPEDDIFRLRDAKVMDGKSPYQLHFPQPKKARGGETDRLGYLVPNHRIREAAYLAVKDMPNVTIYDEQSVEDVHVADDYVTVSMENGDTVTAKLLVCADSRFSTIRQKMGIPTDMHQFGRTVITFRVTHTRSNDQTACERFHYGRTLAILPLTDTMSNMVITIDSDKAEKIEQLTDEELAQDIYAETNGDLGEITIASSRHTYPLVGTHARRFYAKRTALIGDTAVGMHPVTAHGFNLGLKSLDILSQLILNAYAKGQDIGQKSLLEQYNFKHMLNTRPIYHGTNAVVKLFTTETAPAHFLRSAVLRISNNLPPLKKIISHQLTG
ncbi:MAG: 5-demethoxyubiquinol-8 5-hydroxylase UbiM [Neisseriaceae bacterium]|nr:5-demethoxyubiquinol-8 5-hydroxylase UbiM [Neisseriaceae bacterium]